jgi:hypothetical protein
LEIDVTLILDTIQFVTLILDKFIFNPGEDVLVIGSLTTGQEPLIAGSAYTFQLNAAADGQWWNLAGATVNCLLQPPAGPLQTIAAPITNGSPVTAATTLSGPTGSWQRQWQVTIGGKTYYNNFVTFPVESTL